MSQFDTMMHDIRNLLQAQNITVQMLKKAGDKDMKKFPGLIQTLEKSILEMKKKLIRLQIQNGIPIELPKRLAQVFIPGIIS